MLYFYLLIKFYKVLSTTNHCYRCTLNSIALTYIFTIQLSTCLYSILGTARQKTTFYFLRLFY